jgi:hypothetical protein
MADYLAAQNNGQALSNDELALTPIQTDRSPVDNTHDGVSQDLQDMLLKWGQEENKNSESLRELVLRWNTIGDELDDTLKFLGAQNVPLSTPSMKQLYETKALPMIPQLDEDPADEKARLRLPNKDDEGETAVVAKEEEASYSSGETHTSAAKIKHAYIRIILNGAGGNKAADADCIKTVKTPRRSEMKLYIPSRSVPSAEHTTLEHSSAEEESVDLLSTQVNRSLLYDKCPPLAASIADDNNEQIAGTSSWEKYDANAPFFQLDISQIRPDDGLESTTSEVMRPEGAGRKLQWNTDEAKALPPSPPLSPATIWTNISRSQSSSGGGDRSVIESAYKLPSHHLASPPRNIGPSIYLPGAIGNLLQSPLMTPLSTSRKDCQANALFLSSTAEGTTSTLATTAAENVNTCADRFGSLAKLKQKGYNQSTFDLCSIQSGGRKDVPDPTVRQHHRQGKASSESSFVAPLGSDSTASSSMPYPVSIPHGRECDKRGDSSTLQSWIPGTSSTRSSDTAVSDLKYQLTPTFNPPPSASSSVQTPQGNVKQASRGILLSSQGHLLRQQESQLRKDRSVAMTLVGSALHPQSAFALSSSDPCRDLNMKTSLDEDDVEIVEEESILLDTRETNLYHIRERLVHEFENLGARSSRPTSRLSNHSLNPNDGSIQGANSAQSSWKMTLTPEKEVKKREEALRARERDLTIQALSKAEMANVKIEIWTESRRGRWTIRGPVSDDGESLMMLEKHSVPLLPI